MRFWKTVWGVAGIVLFTSSLASAASLQRLPESGGRDVVRPRVQAPVRPPVTNSRIPGRPPIADALEGVLANGLQRRLGLNDDQLNRIRPALRNSLRRRNELAQASIRKRSELNQALREGDSETRIDTLIRELDDTNRQLREAREEFFISVDPDLSPRQRAMLRNEFPDMEDQIRNLIEQSRRQGQ